jgi:hypothetical protein
MSLSMVEWLQSIGVPVSEATQQNIDDECVDVRAIMGLNDDQLRELSFSVMGLCSTMHHPGAAASTSSRDCLFAAYMYSRHVLAALACSSPVIVPQ